MREGKAALAGGPPVAPGPGPAAGFWPRLWCWWALGGAGAWLALAVSAPFEGLRAFGSIGYALALGPLVIVPLGLSLAATGRRGGGRFGGEALPYCLAACLHPVAVVLAVVGLAVPAGAAAFLALPYLVETLALFNFGLYRLATHGLSCLEEVCIDVGLVYLAVGGAWWLATCGGMTLGFAPVIVQLTAVHFHFAGFAAAVMAGLAGRAVPRGARRARGVYRFGAVTAVGSPILVAVGIAISPAVEVVAAAALVVGMTALGAVLVVWVAPRRRRRLPRLLLAFAGLSLVVPMVMALLFAVGELRGVALVGLDTMARGHGLLNAFGFALCGLLGWWLEPPESRLPPPGAPFSRLSAEGRVGADFFDRLGLVDEARPVAGFVEDFSAYARDGFDPAEVDPAVRAFYERTADFAIHVQAAWQPGFRLAGRAYRWFARGMGQLNLPLALARDAEMESRLFALLPGADGRDAVRVWVRTYRAGGEPVYVAAYSLHRYRGVPYMNIAFPLPGGNLTSVLRMDPVPGAPGALCLTTRPGGEGGGDEGVFAVNPVVPMRLPLEETITVWPHRLAPGDGPEALLRAGGDAGAGAVFARHDLWLLGLRYLRVDYLLVPKTG